MEKLIKILREHGVNSVISGGELYAKFYARIGDISFLEYERITKDNIMPLLGY